MKNGNRTPRTLAVVAAGLLALAGGITPQATAAEASPPGSGWTLAFGDEFDDTTVDTAKWNFRTDVKAYSAQRKENVTESGGSLSINLKKEAYAGKEFTGGGVVSKQRLRYGYYETRARINDGSGWHSSFWLMGGDGSTTFPADQRTEVDGFEIDSVNPTKLAHNVHSWKGSGATGPVHYGSGTYDSGLDLRQWHTYGIDWSESGVKFYLDGTLKYTAAYTPDQWTHDYTAIWLTSIAYGTVPDATRLPSAMQFDYVRYWQRDYYVDNDGPAAYGYSTSGTWSASSLSGWTKDSPMTYACDAGATATWRPRLRSAGTYEVFVRKTATPGGDPAAGVALDNNGTVTRSTLDERTGSSGWASLGTRSYAEGTGAAVSLTASGTGCVHADAVKFVRR
ncbi:glycoside hydrolase family 16 protein [Streptomyces sp. NBC_01591]|uniref:glycoside hydrolase family 16 protein n=1 Tax=Streptomyces sp. NBC_01591 TaxID=2975888 RepID=UPI002DD9C251|nr:glycoside hydrolase family 16 protein [Streptomyces sp. NBC_01591]WSD66800.1 glycoside hydrolase family 16 protein [Streptomyces sp. NBC_01591]